MIKELIAVLFPHLVGLTARTPCRPNCSAIALVSPPAACARHR
ncbi:hypothetical protein [Nonomuraea sp. NPDC050783]